MPSKKRKARDKARKFIAKNGIRTNRKCQLCGKVRDVIPKVLNPQEWYNAVLLCKECSARLNTELFTELPDPLDIRSLKRNEVSSYSPSAFRQKRHRFIKRAGIKTQPCTQCGSDAHFYTASKSDPLEVYLLCKKCFGKLSYSDSLGEIPTVNLRTLASRETRRGLESKVGIKTEKENLKKAAESVTKLYLALFNPPLGHFCQFCGDEIDVGTFMYPSVDNPLIFYHICLECSKDYDFTLEVLSDDPATNPVNLVRNAGNANVSEVENKKELRFRERKENRDSRKSKEGTESKESKQSKPKKESKENSKEKSEKISKEKSEEKSASKVLKSMYSQDLGMDIDFTQGDVNSQINKVRGEEN